MAHTTQNAADLAMRSVRRWGVLAFLAVAIAASVPEREALAKDPAVYDSPEAAAQAILDALAKEDRDAILTVLGDKFADQLFTDEKSRENANYRRVVAAAKENMQLRADDEN